MLMSFAHSRCPAPSLELSRATATSTVTVMGGAPWWILEKLCCGAGLCPFSLWGTMHQAVMNVVQPGGKTPSNAWMVYSVTWAAAATHEFAGANVVSET